MQNYKKIFKNELDGIIKKDLFKKERIIKKIIFIKKTKKCNSVYNIILQKRLGILHKT